MTLADYVMRYSERGACQCGRCADAPPNPADHQPIGHTADVMFFKVRAAEGACTESMRALVECEAPACLDGREHGYIEIGALVGDQGLALQLMGLGALLGLWELMTPRSMLGRLGIDEASMMRMAGQGMVTIRRHREDEKENTR